MPTLLLAGAALVMTNCAAVTPREAAVGPARSDDGLICEWGTQRFDLCRYDTQTARVQALLAAMTLDEKLGQMTQAIWHNGVSPDIVRDYGIGSVIHTEGPVPGPQAEDWLDHFDTFQQASLKTRLGIPLLIGVDAIHGQNTFEGAVIFPHNIGMAATGNLALIQRASQITAREVVGTGFNWTFAPCIAMPQSEFWGRVYEGFSEDRDFTEAAAVRAVLGLQGQTLAAHHTVAATAKHFIGDGATEGGEEGGNAVMSDQWMREHYLPPYRAAVDQGVAAVMVGFNAYNAVNMHQHRYLVTDVLKGELGFDGVVVTDWDGGLRFGAPHTVINAGIDIAMQPGSHHRFISELRASVLDGTVPLSRIDDAVRRILTLKFKLGLFSAPFAKREFAADIGSDAHREVARQAVRESMVLLKSEENVLPLSASTPLAVVGEHAHNSGLQSGGWTIHWQGQQESYRGATTILEGIRAQHPAVEYAENGCHDEMAADTVVAVVGEVPYAEGAGDTEAIWLSDAHKALVEGCVARDKRVVTVLISGRPLVVNDTLEKSAAFIAAWLPGSEGAGVADVLFAIDGFAPVGRLPYAWPASASDVPLAQDAEDARFPYGFGLSEY